jgi:hypothetical protein
VKLITKAFVFSTLLFAASAGHAAELIWDSTVANCVNKDAVYQPGPGHVGKITSVGYSVAAEENLTLAAMPFYKPRRLVNVTLEVENHPNVVFQMIIPYDEFLRARIPNQIHDAAEVHLKGPCPYKQELTFDNGVYVPEANISYDLFANSWNMIY